MAAPAGWYPDPDSARHVRWWDGYSWGNPPRLRVNHEAPATNVPHVRFRRTNQSGFSEHHAPSGMGSQNFATTLQHG